MLIRLGNGELIIGKWKPGKESKNDHSLEEPENADVMMLEAAAWINTQLPVLLSIRQSVLIVCPAIITYKARWQHGVG